MLGGIIFIAVSNYFSVVPARLTAQTIDIVSDYLKQKSLNVNTQWSSFSDKFLWFLFLIFSFTLLRGLFMFFMRQTIIVMSRKIEYDLKNDLFNSLLNMSNDFFKNNKTGDLMARMSEDISQVRMYLGPGIMYSINLLIMFIVIVYSMLKTNVMLTVYVLIPLPVLSLAVYLISRIINRQSIAVQRKIGELSVVAQESFSGIRVLKSNYAEQKYSRLLQKLSFQYHKLVMRQVKTDALYQPFILFLVGLSIVITIYVGGLKSISGEITYGNIAEFIIYVNMLIWPVTSLGWVTAIIQKAEASMERINSVMNNQEKSIRSISKKTFHFSSDIEVKNVSLKYENTGIEALKNISMKFQKGSKIGIIGNTGSGKTTLLNLLTKFIKNYSGEILIDGTDIRSIDDNDLRRAIGYVPQEVFLFSDTIRNNIAFSAKGLGLSFEEIQNAANFSDIANSIEQMPQKYETIIGERGVTLSGGQKQRISISRAIMSKPQILILDDCLSAVDNATEETILKNIENLRDDITLIVSSHRISSVKVCDQIIVFNDGRVIESGSHHKLIEQKGAYYNMFLQQSGEEIKNVL